METEIEKIKKEIQETRKVQQAYAFGHRKQNAAEFGSYEKKLEDLYRKLNNLQK